MDEAPKSYEDVLIIDRRHTSWYVAGLLLLLLITFVVGFIWGRRASMLEEQQKIADDAFVDKAQYALLAPETKEQTEVVEAVADIQPAITQRYQAQLNFGYGQLTRAQALVNRLKQHGIVTKIITRKGRNGNKRTVWYQVVTEPYTDLAELELLVQRLKTTERLKNIKIITMNETSALAA